MNKRFPTFCKKTNISICVNHCVNQRQGVAWRFNGLFFNWLQIVIFQRIGFCVNPRVNHEYNN